MWLRTLHWVVFDTLGGLGPLRADMSYDLKLEATPRHLAMTLCGQMNYEACREAMEVLVTEAVAREFPPILVDLLEMEADLSATELFELVDGVKDSGFGSRSRVAVVGQLRPPFDRLGFAVEIAEHRGLQMQGFRCPDQARAWLAG